MRSRRALVIVLLLATTGALLSRSGQAETASPASADAGQPDASTPSEPADAGTSDELPAITPSAPAMPGLPPAAIALPKPKSVEPSPVPGKDLKLPEDTPPISENDLAIEAGWNSDAPVGIRYMRKIETTDVEFGVGLGGVTIWGPKLSGIVRYQPAFAFGIFAQVSAGFTEGGSFTETTTPPGGQPATVHLVRTPSRTIDLLAGWRWPWSTYYVEGAAGYSFNLAGTVLQDSTQTLVPFDVSKVPYPTAGGPAGDVALGWFF